jgi:hypothetical protein
MSGIPIVFCPYERMGKKISSRYWAVLLIRSKLMMRKKKKKPDVVLKWQKRLKKGLLNGMM